MKKYLVLPLTFTSLGLTACAPNLVVQDADISFTGKQVKVIVKNVGNRDAGAHLTYIEINEVGASDAAKPQSQYSAHVPGIAAGSSWNSGPIGFASFSSPRGLNLFTLTGSNLVVRADAKDMVKESNENDNILDRNY